MRESRTLGSGPGRPYRDQQAGAFCGAELSGTSVLTKSRIS